MYRFAPAPTGRYREANYESETSMATCTPYHTTTPELHPRYHNKTTCPDGKRIKPEHRRSGTAGRPLCLECQKVS